MIGIWNDSNRKEIPGIRNPKNVVDITENIHDFNKQQKGKGINILTLKQMLQSKSR